MYTVGLLFWLKGEFASPHFAREIPFKNGCKPCGRNLTAAAEIDANNTTARLILMHCQVFAMLYMGFAIGFKMSENKKWLTDQLLDIFEKYKQVKNLNPAIVGFTKSGQAKYKKSPKFTPTLRIVLQAIVKYDKCYMSLQTISNISGVDRRNVQPNIKILAQNQIITVENRTTKSGDADSNYYTFHMNHFLTFFEERKKNAKVGIKHPNLPVDNFEEVGIKHPKGRDDSSTRVGIKHPPIKQELINNNKKQERVALSENFLPNEKIKAYVANESGYSDEEATIIFNDFLDEYVDNEEFQLTPNGWQRKLKKWFKIERRKPGFLSKKKPNENNIVHINTYQPAPPVSYEQNQRNMKSSAELLGKLNLKPKGVGSHDKDDGRMEERG